MKSAATINIRWDDDQPGADLSISTYPSPDENGRIPNTKAAQAMALMIRALSESGCPILPPKQKVLIGLIGKN